MHSGNALVEYYFYLDSGYFDSGYKIFTDTVKTPIRIFQCYLNRSPNYNEVSILKSVN